MISEKKKAQEIEDLAVWQKARVMASEVYSTCRTQAFSRDFGLRDQACRAAVSVMANIAEGFGRHSNKDFAKFLYIAKGSAFETLSHLCVAMDQSYLDQTRYQELKAGYQEVIRMLIGFIRTLESRSSDRY
jgi:four helix bundle protein